MPFYDDEDTGGGYRGDSYQRGSYRGGGGYHRGGYRGGGYMPRRQHLPPLHTEKIITERKLFFLDLKENDRGRVVKITEDVRGRRDTIMVPVETLREFIEALQRVEAVQNGQLPAASSNHYDDEAEEDSYDAAEGEYVDETEATESAAPPQEP